jgi:caffeoyl-CoA O-methyltransferase
MDIVDPAVNAYLLTHCTASDDVLRDLYDETHRDAADASGMQVSHDEGELLTMLVRLVGATSAVEVGVFTGYSSICIARGLAEGGRLLACDVSEEWTGIARRYWERAGVSDRIDLRIAPAADTLRALPAEPTIDFAFIDADKTGYPVYYDELVTRLRPGGLIVLDNVLRDGRVLDDSFTGEADVVMRELNDTIARDDRVDTVMLPVRDGVTLARRR